MFNYHRRKTITVDVGGVKLGSEWPVRVQSMTNTDTNDIERSAEQCQRIADAGGELVRLTAQGVREAEGIGMIHNLLRKQGCQVPLVADIHFNPRAAFAAAALCEKVRINPGNFVDPARTFKSLEYTDEEYRAELQKIHDTLLPFIQICRDHHTAVRLGVNHGSLSDRIMSRYGNTAAGMVESVMEFLRVFVAEGFTDVVISMKASNVVVMIEAVRRLVAAMDREDMHFPLHLGVTEAGFGEDGRIKSAVGIGTLLGEGLGDTIRVSLSEDPELEIPVAQKLVQYITSREGHDPIAGAMCAGYDPLCPPRREPRLLGGKRTPLVIASCDRSELKGTMQPDYTDDELVDVLEQVLVITPEGDNIPGSLLQQLHELEASGNQLPVIARAHYNDTDSEWLQVKAGADLGAVMLSGLCDGIWIDAPQYPDQDEVVRIAFGILQACRVRMSKTEFISCPSCGRTLFDLQTTVHRVQQATAHLTHLKIGVMGCIVNGPGEMADADYGYVGAARGKISLYKGKQCIEMNIPEADAIDRLVALIKQHGDWREP
ncbi:MAG: (E)-4-hydroxy-3-methylbut-2-enyl-diphosphate synthase [Muribaculaceae bacterium]|nr:(E)-4-hydroxy-3-methylbut-2-enyl-diphosphate synthase [Muribaculaceae bacterium]MBR1474451.1 (E)-4-hydroxy-3-methylbut-2-enyl-diphosphate synthase [Muribaculaceae bacterium]MBR1727145.1 (E)-4-hydroxy-3-methylbut-2-enyl-diphosphate synthase [Muribaculaceae bacterium]